MFQFGIGMLAARPIGGNLGTPSTPIRFGTLQDVTIDIDQKLVELRGQYKFPDDTAPGDMTMKGKAAFGRIDLDAYNSLFFADTIADGITAIIDGEEVTITGGTDSADPVVVAEAATFGTNLAVRYKDTGVSLIEVDAGDEAAGKYSVDPATGTYTFDPADVGKTVLISYTYADATAGRTLPITNQIMGYGPVFEIFLGESFQGRNGMHICRCRASKMNKPLKRDNYEIPDFEFSAYAGPDGLVAEMIQETP